jgi:hypothetical protein
MASTYELPVIPGVALVFGFLVIWLARVLRNRDYRNVDTGATNSFWDRLFRDRRPR